MKQKTNYPFPFFGAGEAGYYERAEVIVRFVNTPSEEEKNRIENPAPPPIKPQNNNFCGNMLMAEGGQSIQKTIKKAYAGKSEEKFNADIERWLSEVHSFCPIQFVYRKEDFEAGGIKFSDWHKQSIKKAKALTESLENDKTVYSQTASEKELFVYALKGILEYAKQKATNFSPEFTEFFFPEEMIGVLIKQGKTEKAVDAVMKSLPDSLPFEALDEYYEQFEYETDFCYQLIVRVFNDRKRSQQLKEDPVFFLTDVGYFCDRLITMEDWPRALDICNYLLKIPNRIEDHCRQLLRIHMGMKTPSPEMDKVIETVKKEAYKMPVIFHLLAYHYMWQNKPGEALEQIQLAKNYHYESINFMKTDKEFKPLFNHPGFIAIFSENKNDKD